MSEQTQQREAAAPTAEMMVAAREAAQGITPAPGWSLTEWLQHYGHWAGYAGVIAATMSAHERQVRAKVAGELVRTAGGYYGMSGPEGEKRIWYDALNYAARIARGATPAGPEAVQPDSLRAGIEALDRDLNAARDDGTIYTYGEVQRRLRALLAEMATS